MKKCPYCSAEIQENAQFCLYCMKPLSEKEEIKAEKPKKKLLLVFVLLAVVIIAVTVSAVAFLSSDKSPENEGDTQNNKVSDSLADSSAEVTSDSIIASTTATEAPQEQESPSSESEKADVIVSYDDFLLQALMATSKLGYNELWNPMELVETHIIRDEWNIYSCDINIPEADLMIMFYNGGEEIVTVISSLTDETFIDGICLYEGILSGIINYTFTNYQKMMTDRDMYPMKKREDNTSMLDEIGFPDTAAEKTDSDSETVIEYRWSEIEDDSYLLYELRTRTYNGIKYYDIFMYNTVQ